MRMLPALLLVPALTGAAFSQSVPRVVVLDQAAATHPSGVAADSGRPDSERLPGISVVHPTPFDSPIERIRIPVAAPPLKPGPSVDAVFPPAPQGLIDTPTALKYRRFLIDVQAEKSQTRPAACPASDCPVANPFAAKRHAAQPRTAKTIRLKYVGCTDTYRRLRAKLATQACVSPAAHDAHCGCRAIVVPEPATNSLLVIGTAKQIEELQRAVKDEKPVIDHYLIVVYRIDPDGKKTAVARPQVAVARGREARFEIAQDSGSVFKMSLRVSPIRQAGLVKVLPHPPLTAVNDRCFDGRITLIPPPAPGVFEQDRTAVLRVAHAAIAKHAKDADNAAAVKRLRLQVRAYSVKDLLEQGGHNSGACAEALMTVIRMTVDRKSWNENGGYGTIRYYAPTQALVIRHSADGHHRISELLNQLRTLRSSN